MQAKIKVGAFVYQYITIGAGKINGKQFFSEDNIPQLYDDEINIFAECIYLTKICDARGKSCCVELDHIKEVMFQEHLNKLAYGKTGRPTAYRLFASGFRLDKKPRIESCFYVRVALVTLVIHKYFLEMIKAYMDYKYCLETHESIENFINRLKEYHLKKDGYQDFEMVYKEYFDDQNENYKWMEFQKTYKSLYSSYERMIQDRKGDPLFE